MAKKYRYNQTMHDSRFLTKGSIEFKLVLLFRENGGDMDAVQKSEMFEEYVQEIYDYLYGDTESETIKAMRLSVCRKRARDNIRKKAKLGKIAIMSALQIDDYLELAEEHGGRNVARVVQQKINSAVAS